MTDRRPSRPRDPNQLAKRIVDLATGDAEEADSAPAPIDPTKNLHAVELGRKGGLKGGRARADSMTPAHRKEIAQKAAAARWKK